MAATACAIDTERIASAIDPSQLLQEVRVEYHAYNLSLVEPYNTVTLNVRGLSGTGSELEAPMQYTYDSRYVTISADGILTAIAPVSSTKIKATMSFNGATRVDSAVVSVIANAPTHLARVAILPNSGDSAKIAYGSGTKRLQLVRNDSNNVNVSSALVWVESSDLSVATISQSNSVLTVSTRRPGSVVFRVSTYAYGTGFRDSLSFLVGWPLNQSLYSRLLYEQGTLKEYVWWGTGKLYIGVGGCVVWWHLAHIDADVVFEDPTYAAPPDSAAPAVVATCKAYADADTSASGTPNGGNIAPWRTPTDIFFTTRARGFPKPGIVHYRSALYGTEVEIVVCDETHDPSCSPEFYPWGVPEDEQ